MSDHADTIRRATTASARAIELHLRVPDLTVEEQEDVLALIRGMSADVHDLVAERQQAIDALREIEQLLVDDGYALDDARAIARAALVSLGETE